MMCIYAYRVKFFQHSVLSYSTYIPGFKLIHGEMAELRQLSQIPNNTLWTLLLTSVAEDTGAIDVIFLL